MFSLVTIVILMIDRSFQSVVSTVQGRIQGISREGYISYNGIPYASVSGEAGRYKRGGLAPVWTDVRESHEAYCTPSSPVEECLQLDVNVPPGSRVPVLVWVTGGVGHYDPTMIVQRGIIVVVVRHRLGAIGFLCSNDNKIPGNAGLKDVVMALRWVRDNIVAFNGNPHMVIVAGQSFGAAMVQSLMLSPMARGLFHGAIIQSGSVLAPWAFNFDAEERAKMLKLKLNGTRDTFAFVKAVPVELATKTEELEFPYLPFGICIDHPLKNEERFFPDSPLELLSNGKMVPVPVIMGYANNEAYIFTSLLKEVQVMNKMLKKINFLIPIELQMSKREVPQLAKKVKDMYFEGNMSMESVLKYHRDAYFLSHIHKSVRFQATAKSSVYFYQFSHSGNVGVEKEPGGVKAGAAHSDELAYLFSYKGRKLDGDDGVVQEHLVKLWTNFVKHLYFNPHILKIHLLNAYSFVFKTITIKMKQIFRYYRQIFYVVVYKNYRNPTPSGEDVVWEPFNLYDNRMLDIKIDMEMMEFPFKKEMQMWDEIYERFYYERRI